MVGFMAALDREQVNLLPPSEAPRLLQDIALQYPDVYVLTDNAGPASDLEVFPYPEQFASNEYADVVPAFDKNQVAAIAFTSGSTGKPGPNVKTWGSLVNGAEKARSRFWPHADSGACIVGTVPQQHMYGLETTIMLPSQSGLSFTSERPFYPEDIRQALAGVSIPRILVTTPLHIRACAREKPPLPEIEIIISATAPLSQSLAREAEAQFKTRVYEIYGCTEAGSVASRRTIEGDKWYAYDGTALTVRGEKCFVETEDLEQPVELADVVVLSGPGEFTLHGRKADMINIGGKRGSLADLNYKLNNIEGVQDGVFFMPDDISNKVNRLTAFVVAPRLSRTDLNYELKQSLDPVFLPRPVYFLDSLPRSASGKLPRDQLVELARDLAHASKHSIKEP
ncbi:MAG: xanthomonadin biosynthesis 3-hydroxybenozate--AMP ligase XanA2 [Gammaproteobacteria bacterium]|nr:MAG: xanthomonadin biosynthesis 3-hydroxybenozate--AMP ligase XanA2 [Gammaproteobacteria bacterium]